MNHILYQKHETVTENPQKRIYVNKIGNRKNFKIKTWCYLKILKLKEFYFAILTP